MIAIILSLFIVVLVPADANQYSNPIVPSAPDPWMEYYKGYYYLIATTFRNNVGIRKSKTLDGLRFVTNKVVYSFTGGQLWAPEIHQVDGKWYLYYTACEGANQDSKCHRNHVAESDGDDPMGPYHHKARLVYPGDEIFELDPSLIKINGKLYLLGSYITNTQALYIQPLSNPYTVSGPKHTLSEATYPWEKQGWTINEGPEPLYHNGKVFVVYSASNCNTPDYKLGLLEFTGTDPLNRAHWKKHPNPVFQRNDQNHVYGPGHNGFFKSPDGKEDWIVYHANDSPNGKCDGGRSSRAQKFTWGSDGLPVFGVPEATGVKHQSPSGE